MHLRQRGVSIRLSQQDRKQRAPIVDCFYFSQGVVAVGQSKSPATHLMPNMQGEAAAAVDGVMRAAINKRTDDVG